MDAPRLDPAAVVWNRPPADRNGRPLLVLVHGRGGAEHDFDPFLFQLPHEYAIAAVRAPHAHNRGWAWYPTKPPGGGLTFSEIANRAADTLLDWVRGQPGHPAVDLLGFSQGAALAVHTLRRDPHAIRAVVALAGFRAHGRQAGDSKLRATQHPAFFGHGSRDDVIPPKDADHLQEWLRKHTDVEVHRYPELAHWMSREQFDDVSAFLRRLPLAGSF
jgi:phospholipase/carboxylesterase